MLVLCLVFGVLAITVFSQAVPIRGPADNPDVNCHVRATEYYLTLDKLFHHEARENPSLILRFIPSGETERQIVIDAKSQGVFEVTEFTLPRGSQSVWQQVLDLRDSHPGASAAEFASLIKVERRIAKFKPGVLPKLMKSFEALRISPALSTKVLMDPSGYDFWYIAVSPCNTLHISISDADYRHDADAYPLVRWMNQMRLAVETESEPN